MSPQQTPIRDTERVQPGHFEPPAHYYPRTLNAQIHPLVRAFMRLGNDRVAARYVHLHPEVDPASIRAALAHRPRHFRWGGADLFHVATAEGVRRIVVIETNSCPSGQKSMPLIDDGDEHGGYRRLIEGAFLPMLKRRGLPQGGLAVIYDKNYTEASGYAAAMADATGEPVHLVPCFASDPDLPLRVTDGVIHFRDAEGAWRPIRAALRYVTQRPWSRIPPITRTALMNPVVVCLAGGRNKMLGAKAYDLHNARLRDSGLMIRTPETIWDVSLEEVPLWVTRLGGVAVVKVPYSNAGQGVYTLTSREELEAFMALPHRYDRFIVQALIGNHAWSSRGVAEHLYHVGTIPDRHNHIYVSDLRVMVGVGVEGFFPTALYARRARTPLQKQPPQAYDHTSWSVLGTNLSVKLGDDQWASESERLLLMDSRDFNRLGLGVDDLVEAYVQTVLSVSAIDHMACDLINAKGRFRARYFKALNPDPALSAEILLPPKPITGGTPAPLS
ncbi:MAG: hypothetical protein ACE366_19495 [Bradymonadia bacterium]